MDVFERVEEFLGCDTRSVSRLREATGRRVPFLVSIKDLWFACDSLEVHTSSRTTFRGTARGERGCWATLRAEERGEGVEMRVDVKVYSKWEGGSRFSRGKGSMLCVWKGEKVSSEVEVETRGAGDFVCATAVCVLDRLPFC